MLKIDPSRQASKFTTRLPAKHQRQLAETIEALRINPMPHDSQQLRGNLNRFRRVTCGEYRIAYYVDGEVLRIAAIAKRNDDEVYNLLRRL